jgi:hypothetical protein
MQNNTSTKPSQEMQSTDSDLSSNASHADIPSRKRVLAKNSAPDRDPMAKKRDKLKELNEMRQEQTRKMRKTQR